MELNTKVIEEALEKLKLIKPPKVKYGFVLYDGGWYLGKEEDGKITILTN